MLQIDGYTARQPAFDREQALVPLRAVRRWAVPGAVAVLLAAVVVGAIVLGVGRGGDGRGEGGAAPALPGVVQEGDGRPAGDTPLTGPIDVAVGPDGLLYVADPAEQRVRRIDPDGTVVTVAGMVGAECDDARRGVGIPATSARLCGPERIVFDGDALLIADVRHQRIRRVDPDGTITDLSGAGEGEPYLAPSGLAVGGATLYVTDLTSGRLFRGAGSPEPLLGDLVEPRGVAVDPNGVVHVADAAGRIVRVVDGEGETAIGPAGPGETAVVDDPQLPLSSPWDVVFDDDGGMWIADAGAAVVRYRALAGGLSLIPGPFAFPTGIALGDDGRVYVADRDAGQVWRISADRSVEPVFAER